MTALLATSLVLLAVGSAWCLDGLPWFRDRPVAQRLRPYVGRGTPASGRPTGLSGVREVLAPIAIRLGGALSRLLGVQSDLATRLERAGRDADVDAFRLRQLSHATLALGAAGGLALLLRPPAALTISGVLGTPVLAVLLHEHALSGAAERRRQRLAAELPVLAEQLGLLVGAGYSVTGALTRLAARSGGVVADDLHRVLLRIRHGTSEHAALGEWAQSSGVDAVARLTSILALHGETADLGLLISDEARSIRAEAHRSLLETIERRAQLVWIPVTVATLVPGLIFLAVPFTAAMSQVTGGGS